MDHVHRDLAMGSRSDGAVEVAIQACGGFDQGGLVPHFARIDDWTVTLRPDLNRQSGFENSTATSVICVALSNSKLHATDIAFVDLDEPA